MLERQLTDQLIAVRSRLVSIINDTEKRLHQAPEGNVRVISHEKGYQFYLREKSSDKNGVYMPVAERDKAVALIQKSYDQRIVRTSREQVKVIDRFLRKYDPEILKEVYASMPKGRRVFVRPMELPDAEYIQEWVSFET